MRTLRRLAIFLLVAIVALADGPGFRNRKLFEEHYAKHGREFGNISPDEYLHRAQALRDAAVGGPILQAVKPDGVITRFDRKTGAFGAYNPDRTIRTFFIPNNGERYFHRQAKRPE
jgi:pyocin large subunit-like protein